MLLQTFPAFVLLWKAKRLNVLYHHFFAKKTQSLRRSLLIDIFLEFEYAAGLNLTPFVSSALLDDLDKELNNYIMRCREWYGWHFPELGKVITDNLAYCKTVRKIGNLNFSSLVQD